MTWRRGPGCSGSSLVSLGWGVAATVSRRLREPRSARNGARLAQFSGRFKAGAPKAR